MQRIAQSSAENIWIPRWISQLSRCSNTWRFIPSEKYHIEKTFFFAKCFQHRLISLSYIYKVGAKPSSQYLYFKPEGPCGGVQAVRIEDEIFPAQVELRRPVAEGPGGQAGSSVGHQVQRHVAGTCRDRTRNWNPNSSQTLQLLSWQDGLFDKLFITNGSIARFHVWYQQAV